jgi:hypothetical protein
MMSEFISGWDVPITGVLCPVCDWSYLLIGEKTEDKQKCPHCFRGILTPITLDQAVQHNLQHPELVITPTVSSTRIDEGIVIFTREIPYPPEDLNPEVLRQRLRLFYLPVWLVDSQVTAIWNAEAGFDYEVVSHQERFVNGGWSTYEVKETRVRWESRVGRLERSYENVSAPALEISSDTWQRLGSYRVEQAEPYSADKVVHTLMRMPNQSPEDVWSHMTPSIQNRAALEVKAAVDAQHIRRFSWAPDYHNKIWTLLLVSVYATYYTDDAGQLQPIHIHARTGKVDGVRRSSMIRAQKLSLILGIIAIVGFILSLGLGVAGVLFPPLFVIAIIGGLIFAGLGLGACVPVIRAWRFNLRTEDQ